MSFWDSADNLSALLSIFGWTLISVIVFVRQLFRSKRDAAKKTEQNETSKNYNEINLKSCFTGILFSIIAIVLFKIYSFWVYKFIITGNMPNYSIALYALCLMPIPVAILGAFIGLAIGKRDL